MFCYLKHNFIPGAFLHSTIPILNYIVRKVRMCEVPASLVYHIFPEGKAESFLYPQAWHMQICFFNYIRDHLTDWLCL